MANTTRTQTEMLVEHWRKVHDSNLENRDLSQNTLRKYHTLLEKLIEFVGKPLDEMSEPEVFGFITRKNEDGQEALSPRVQKQTAIDINKILQRCRIMLSDTVDPSRIGKVRKIKAKKKQRIDPNKLITAEDMPAIIAKIDNLIFKGAVALLYETACRADELLNTRIGDWRPDSTNAFAEVWIHKSKTKKRLLISDWSFPFVTQALMGRDLSDPEAPLFINRKGKALKYTTLVETVKKASKEAVGKELTPHMFRKSRITEWFREGAKDTDIQDWAGWADLQMVPIYRSVSAEQSAQAQREHYGLDPMPQQKSNELLVSHCSKCKRKISEGMNFCGYCGLAVGASAQRLISSQNGFVGTQSERDLQGEIEGMKGVISELVETVKALKDGDPVKKAKRQLEIAEQDADFKDYVERREAEEELMRTESKGAELEVTEGE